MWRRVELNGLAARIAAEKAQTRIPHDPSPSRDRTGSGVVRIVRGQRHSPGSSCEIGLKYRLRTDDRRGQITGRWHRLVAAGPGRRREAGRTRTARLAAATPAERQQGHESQSGQGKSLREHDGAPSRVGPSLDRPWVGNHSRSADSTGAAHSGLTPETLYPRVDLRESQQKS